MGTSLRKIIYSILFCSLYQNITAQTRSDIYLICNSSKNEISEGMWRGDIKYDNDPVYKHPPITFLFESKNVGYTIWFTHYSFNLDKLKKERPIQKDDYQMQILIKPKSFYNNTIMKANPIYIDRIKETFKTAKEAWTWADGLREKTIYLFDGSDPMNWGEEGDGTTIRLIEVRMVATNEPREELVFPD